ncbi:CAF17-like 4Fe-4S cluster assembly/insertion protein YgfZ [Egbenema bharatensis]|uniref:CAF17-like 4Fe-4S cluster assembly/insertion protein YgfZ n=1 Tax=Egbenema bharatensis TaxID=3463334 RepID=UPI003A88909E
MTQALRELQSANGATFTTVADHTVPDRFGNEAEVWQAIETGVVLHDRSHWGRIRVSGDDRLRFLHNQTTNSMQTLQPGQGCDTVFVTSTARTIDLVSAYTLEDAVLLLTSPGYNQKLIQWMDRFIFFADKVELEDLTERTITFSIMGAGSDALLEKVGAGSLVGQPCNNHLLLNINGIETRIAVGCGLALSGHTFFVEADRAADLWKQLIASGAVPMGEQIWEQLRIQQGRPLPDRELTEAVNPLEAGLWYTISLNKGCYIGQETIARLHTYRGVKQQLWGIKLNQFAEPGSSIVANGQAIGKLTSCTQSQNGYFGLAYIRTKALPSELAITVNEQQGELVNVPFLTHEYP